MRLLTPTLDRVIGVGLLVASFGSYPAPATDNAVNQGASAAVTPGSVPVMARRPGRNDFNKVPASQDARQVVDWVLGSGNNRGLPFVIVDKKEAKVFVFHADGRLRGAARALLGSALGDD